MTRLWTETEPAIDAELQQRLALLAGALSPLFDGKTVVFHDARGGFAPVIDRPGELHIHLHGAPKARGTRLTRPRAANELNGDVFGETFTPLPRIHASSSRELSSIACQVRGAKNQRLVQRAGDTLFLLIRPVGAGQTASPDANTLQPIDAAVALDVLLHVMLVHHREQGLRLPARLLNGRPGDLESDITALAANTPMFSASARLLTRTNLRQMLQRAIQGNEPDPLARMRQRLQNLRTDEAVHAQQLADLERKLQQLRQEHQDRGLLSSEEAMTTEMRRQMDAIAQLPQVIDVSADDIHGTPQLKVAFRPMSLGRHQRRTSGLCPLAPIELWLSITGQGELVRIRNLYGTPVAAAHVRSRVCLGSLQEPLRETVKAGDLATAVQLTIGFLQAYNADDPWGRIGTSWPTLNAETGPGNTLRLPLPETRTDAQAPAAAPADTPASGATGDAVEDVAEPAAPADPSPDTPAHADAA